MLVPSRDRIAERGTDSASVAGQQNPALHERARPQARIQRQGDMHDAEPAARIEGGRDRANTAPDQGFLTGRPDAQFDIETRRETLQRVLRNLGVALHQAALDQPEQRRARRRR